MRNDSFDGFRNFALSVYRKWEISIAVCGQICDGWTRFNHGKKEISTKISVSQQDIQGGFLVETIKQRETV